MIEWHQKLDFEVLPALKVHILGVVFFRGNFGTIWWFIRSREPFIRSRKPYIRSRETLFVRATAGPISKNAFFDSFLKFFSFFKYFLFLNSF